MLTQLGEQRTQHASDHGDTVNPTDLANDGEALGEIIEDRLQIVLAFDALLQTDPRNIELDVREAVLVSQALIDR